MNDDSCRNILEAAGFRRIGQLEDDLTLALWWHPQEYLELLVVEINGGALLRGTKNYRLVARGERGEMYTRDLGALESDLTALLGEVHFHLSHFPDLTRTLAQKRIHEKRYRHARDQENPKSDEYDNRLTNLTSEIEASQKAIQHDQKLLSLNGKKTGLTHELYSNRINQTRRRLSQLESEYKTAAKQQAVQERLEREYLNKGSATFLAFSFSSNIQAARGPAEFSNALQAIVQELQNADRYQIRQKLQGSRLQIYVRVIESPGISLLTRWAGGLLSPLQLDRMGPEYAWLRQAVEDQCLVFPKQDIVLGGSVQDEKKLIAARVIRNFLEKLDLIRSFAGKAVRSPRSKMPLWIGLADDGSGQLASPWEFPLDQSNHILISGRTGSGKSFIAFVIVEGAYALQQPAVIILDPRSQWVGLKCPEDRPEILRRYKKFGLSPDQVRGLDFTYCGVGNQLGEPIPEDLSKLRLGYHIISFKGMEDRNRCSLFADILNAVFNACSESESSLPRVLVVVEEVHRFIRKGVDRDAHLAAERAEQSIDRIAREGRKFGLNLMLLTQSSKDISHAMATVRQNIGTHIFLANSEREIEYATQYFPDADKIATLPTGEAFVNNPKWGTVRMTVRPPLSKAWEPGDSDVRKILGIPTTNHVSEHLSDLAQTVMQEVRKEYSGINQPVRFSEIADRLGITSRRMVQDIIAELEKACVARFEQLPGRGRPLVIIPKGEMD